MTDYTRAEMLKLGGRAGAALAAFGSFPLLAGCGNSEQSGGGDTLARIRKQKTVRVGFANEAPYAYSTSDGKLTGIMPVGIAYIVKEIAGAKLEGVLTEFGGLIPGLMANRFDVVGAGLYISAERCAQATPSNPQYTAKEGMAVAAGNPKGIHSYRDVADKGLKMGTLSGSINLDYARDAGIDRSSVVLFPDMPAAISGLKAGRVDAIGMSVVSLQNTMSKSGGGKVELATPFQQPTDKSGHSVQAYGSAYFRKDDKSLVDAYDSKLAEIVKNGKLLDLMRSIGFGKEIMPPKGATAAELCKPS